jgi:hypothetical protein
MPTLINALPPISALQDQMLAQTILCACSEARSEHTAHLQCCGIQVDAVDCGDHFYVALSHPDWHLEGALADPAIGLVPNTLLAN